MPPVTARPVATFLVVSLAAVILAGCGADDVIDDQKTQLAVQYDVEAATGEKVSKVTCPSDVPVDVGNRFTCHVISVSGDEAVAEIEIIRDNGDLRMLGLESP